ncbi:hypothetical protein ACHAWF_016897 [Thalassiosira exigua]
MLYQRVPSDLTESSLCGRMMSAIAIVSMSALFVLETKEYFSSKLGTDLLLNHNGDDDQRIQLNFDITMMDLPCEHASVDVYSTVGFEKNVTKNVRKYPVDAEGVKQRFEARNWHQDDVELWDPAVYETIDDLHKDGEDAISLNEKTFPYALKEFSFVFVNFYTSNSPVCEDFAPSWEAMGEIVTDASIVLVDEHLKELNIGDDDFSEDEYESLVNRLAPVLITKLDCSAHPLICKDQNVKAYPTLRIFVDGEAANDYNGHRTVMELVLWLKHIEAMYREPGELKMQRVEECKSLCYFRSFDCDLAFTNFQLYAANIAVARQRVVRDEEEEEWNNALTSYRAPRLSWNVSSPYPGCQLSGHLLVDRSPGGFTIHAQSYGHAIAAHMTNLSHIVHHFSFGDPETQRYVEEKGLPGIPKGFAKSLHPMDGNVYVTELHQAYHHYLRVVATEFGVGKILNWAREKARRVYRILQNSQLSTYRHHVVPEAKFFYDLSPISVSFVEETRSWYDYITGVLAVLGGTFTVIGLCDSGISSFSRGNRRY